MKRGRGWGKIDPRPHPRPRSGNEFDPRPRPHLRWGREFFPNAERGPDNPRPTAIPTHKRDHGVCKVLPPHLIL